MRSVREVGDFLTNVSSLKSAGSRGYISGGGFGTLGKCYYLFLPD